MGNENQIRILQEGTEAWNKWRRENPDEHIDLTEANLRKANLSTSQVGSTPPPVLGPVGPAGRYSPSVLRDSFPRGSRTYRCSTATRSALRHTGVKQKRRKLGQLDADHVACSVV